MTKIPEPPETVVVDEPVVACDGNGPLGHPRVFLSLEGKNEIDCPYCDRRFALSEKARQGATAH